MKKKIRIAILGSTGSVGTSTLLSLSKVKNYKIKLITTNKNIKKILNQAIRYKVKDVIVEDKKVKQNIIHKSKELHNELDFFSSAFFDSKKEKNSLI